MISELNFNNLAELLHATTSDFNPSELHGLICGLLFSHAAEAHFKKLVLKKIKDETYQSELTQLFETSFTKLNEFSFEFTLLLPDDDVDINIRAEFLGLWCQGFLIGLKKAKIPIKNLPQNETSETLKDIIEIAKINFGNIVDDDEDESAYFELVEYVRLGVLMLFQDLKTTTDAIGEEDEPND